MIKHDKTDSLVSVEQNSSKMAQHFFFYLAYLRKYNYFTKIHYIEVFIPAENSNFEVSYLAGLPGPRNTVNSGKSL